jgi:hypothetical protein
LPLNFPVSHPRLNAPSAAILPWVRLVSIPVDQRAIDRIACDGEAQRCAGTQLSRLQIEF